MSNRSKAQRKASQAPEKDQFPTDARPFNKTWINSCYQETLLPGAPWHKVGTSFLKFFFFFFKKRSPFQGIIFMYPFIISFTVNFAE